MKNIFVLCLSMSVACQLLYSQENLVSLPSPTASAGAKGADVPVNYNNGTASLTIPIYTIQDYDLTIPIYLSYQTGGIRVSEVASWVGLGWDLQTAGSITRVVRDLPDDWYYEDAGNGYDYFGFFLYYGEDPDINCSLPNGTCSHLVDTESDLYFFNVLGFSGSFFFDTDLNIVNVAQNDVLIERFTLSNPTEDYYEVTLPNGLKCTFGDYDASQEGDEAVRSYTHENILNEDFTSVTIQTSWLLRRIVSPAAHQADFIYEREKYVVHSLGENSADIAAPCVNDFIYDAINSVQHSEFLSQRLSEIHTPFTRVEFIAETLREDVDQESSYSSYWSTAGDAKALDEIVISLIKDQNESCLKKFVLDKSYFEAQSEDGFNDDISWIENLDESEYPDLIRLKLDAVHEVSCDETISYSSDIQYYGSDSLSRGLSHAQDYWGFNNAHTENNSLMSKAIFDNDCLPFLNCKGTSNGDFAESRDPSWPEMRAGALKSLSFPNGSNVEIQYEPHDIRSLVYEEGQQAEVYEGSVCKYETSPPCETCNPQSTTGILEIHDVTIPALFSLTATFSYDIFSCNHGDPFVSLYSREAGSGTYQFQQSIYPTSDDQTDLYEDDAFLELFGLNPDNEYDLKFVLSASDGTFNVNIGITELVADIKDVMIGGMRIKSLNKNGLVQTFQYTREAGNPEANSSELMSLEICNSTDCPGAPQGVPGQGWGPPYCNGLTDVSSTPIYVPCEGQIQLSITVNQYTNNPNCVDETMVVEVSWSPEYNSSAPSGYLNWSSSTTGNFDTEDLESTGLERGNSYFFRLRQITEEYGRANVILSHTSEEDPLQDDPEELISSGALVNTPLNIVLLRDYGTEIDNDCYHQPRYRISSSPHTQMKSLSGSHIVYSDVMEMLTSGDDQYGSIHYKFNTSVDWKKQPIIPNQHIPWMPAVSVFPAPAEIELPPLFGTLISKTVYTKDDDIDRTEEYEYQSHTDQSVFQKAEIISSCEPNGDYALFQWYTIQSHAVVPTKTTIEELGVTTTTEYIYRTDRKHLNPIQIVSYVEGTPEEDIVITDIKYAEEAENNLLFDAHMINIPLETLVDGGDGGGSKVTYTEDNERILFESISRARDGGSSWILLQTANDFTDDGLVSSVSRLGISTPELYEWEDGLLLSKSYGERENTYTYNNKRQITASTDFQGISSEYSYDAFNRLESTITNNDRITTAYAYYLENTDSENRVNTISTFNNDPYELPQWESDQYYDVEGRNGFRIKRNYTQSGGDYITGEQYDPLGKVIESCDPAKGGCDVLRYSFSPLRRLQEVTPAGAPRSVFYEHGSNEQSITIGSSGLVYPAHTLYMTRAIDENETVTETFTDFRGRTVMVRRDAEGLSLETRYRFDDRGNMLEVYPPGSNSDGAAPNFIYEYFDDGQLKGKELPDEGSYSYTYTDAEQPETEELPNGSTITYDYHATYIDFLESVSNTGSVRVYTPYGSSYVTGWVATETVQVSDGTSTESLTTTFTRDDLGRVTSEVRGFLDGESSYTYTYDHADNVRQTDRVHSGPDGKDISYTYNFDMSNGIRVDKTRLTLGGLETLSELKYSDGDWLLSDAVGDALHTISYDYNGRGWLTEINSIAPPPPVASDDCDPPGPAPFPHFPMCIEIGDIAILQILYDCAALLAGEPTTVIVNVQTQSGQQTNPIAMNGSDGTETDQTESFDFTISSSDDITLLNNILSTLLADCFQQSIGSIQSEFNLQVLIDQILAQLAKEGGDLYAQKLHYYDANNSLEAPAQYNGNISWMEWKVVGEPYQIYGFQYDGVNRLTQARYSAKLTKCQVSTADYDCSYGYDGRGNFTTIQRNGFLGLNSGGVPQYGQIDNLSFQYTGANTLYRTSESANYTKGFLGSQSTYTYDHGRLTNDSGKNADITKYNFLNQPQVMKVAQNMSVKNYWDANGNLHKQIQYLQGGVEKVRYYQDGIEYFTGPNDEILIESIHHGEGRYVYEYDENGKLKRNYHEFMISDHLGNVRVRFADLNGDGEINIVDEGPGQEKEVLGSYHYYPYGMQMEGIFHPQDLVENNYKYNGIEYLGHQGLNVSLATWRTHDAAIGRWWQIDPRAESMYGYNPFNAMGDNPVSYSDPHGDFIFLAATIGAFIGFSSNVVLNNGPTASPLQALSFTAVGALSGALSAGVGSGVSAAIAGGSFGAGFLGTSGVAATGFLSGAASGASSAFAGGFTSGFGNTLVGGGSLGDALSMGLQTGGAAALTGGLTGGISGGVDALSKGLNFFSGNGKFDLTSGCGCHGWNYPDVNITGKYVGKYEGVSIFEADIQGGVTLPGRGIVVYKGAFSHGLDPLMMQHEFGHILQAREYGVRAFYKVIGPRSLHSAMTHGILGHNHSTFWTETWANYLSSEYFGASYLRSFRYPIKNLHWTHRTELIANKLSPLINGF